MSLDCDQPLAVGIARSLFHLPYEHARMDIVRNGQQIDYRCRRKSREDETLFIYETPSSTTEAKEGTLEWFLVERYVLFSAKKDATLCEGRVHHPPYRIASPIASPARNARSGPPRRSPGMALKCPPVSILGADALEVEVFPLRKL